MRPQANARVTAKPGEPLPRAATVAEPVAPEPIAIATPDERIHSALVEITDAVEAQLLKRLDQATPRFFEGAVLKLLAAMGYAGDLGTSEHADRTGNGGVDGLLDRHELARRRIEFGVGVRAPRPSSSPRWTRTSSKTPQTPGPNSTSPSVAPRRTLHRPEARGPWGTSRACATPTSS